MLNYSNLNDVEFESLCRDILERQLNVPLRRFAPGRDGGIDLTDDVEKKSIIVQIRHYQKSDVGILISSLKNELPKVIASNPQKYYICCSRELSHSKINELYQHFRDYMDSDSQIITILEIDDFLKKPENKNILKKHFKLWLDDTGILEEIGNDSIFVDCEAFLSGVNELHKLFVRTKAFDLALNALQQNRTLCIIGDPGVGKSITSKMLVLYYAAHGYRVRYTSNVTDLAALKASLRHAPHAREVILLDDCFGQAYFEMKSSQSSELLSLIQYVRLHPSKVLILNSRVTIFREAQERHQELIRSLDRDEYRVFVLDMSSLSLSEKAKIFYNHLAFSGIPEDYFEDIRTNQRYRKIISHRNFNPRIIEYVCTPSRYQTIPANQFYAFIRKHLTYPQEMWKNEYEERLQPADRILLQTIYSLTTTFIHAELVRQCFDRRIAGNPMIDKTVDQFSKSLVRLSEGFISILDLNGEKQLSMRNPSVNDFLDGRLKTSPLERNDLIQSICTPEQMRLLPKSDQLPYAIRLLQTGEICNFIFSSPTFRTRFIACTILSAKLCIAKFRNELLEYFIMPSPMYLQLNSSFFNPREQLKNLLLPELWNFYELKAYFSQPGNLNALLSKMDLENATIFIKELDPYFQDESRSEYVHEVHGFLKESISDFCDADACDYQYALNIEHAVNQATDIYPYGSYIDENEAAAILEMEVTDEVLYDLRRMISPLPKPLCEMINSIDEDDIFVSGADFLVEEYLSEQIINSDPREESPATNSEDYASIDAMFL